MAGEGRPLFRIVLRNFINSLMPRQTKGELIGKDNFGNTYYEISSERREGRRASRWFEPSVKEEFEPELPAEWQSWLRHRRKQPPSEEEIAQNLSVSNMKKVNAAKLEAQRIASGGVPAALPETGPETYPKYDEYETGGKPVSFNDSPSGFTKFPEFPTGGPPGKLK